MKGDIKMKNDYEARALKFAHLLARLFEYCDTFSDFINMIKQYNSHHSIPLRYEHGVSRIAILRADYVIKFDYAPDAQWDNGDGTNRAGDNTSEEIVYERAVRDGYAYLLAKTTVVTINGRHISIMPQIRDVNNENKYWGDYVNDEEYDWLVENINDIHEGNVGYSHGKPVVIDYGWDAQ